MADIVSFYVYTSYIQLQIFLIKLHHNYTVQLQLYLKYVLFAKQMTFTVKFVFLLIKTPIILYIFGKVIKFCI